MVICAPQDALRWVGAIWILEWPEPSLTGETESDLTDWLDTPLLLSQVNCFSKLQNQKKGSGYNPSAFHHSPWECFPWRQNHRRHSIVWENVCPLERLKCHFWTIEIGLKPKHLCYLGSFSLTWVIVFHWELSSWEGNQNYIMLLLIGLRIYERIWAQKGESQYFP